METDFITGFEYTRDESILKSDIDFATRKGHISASALKKIKVSPLHFIEEEKKEQTDAMAFGSAYHKYILENDKFDDEYFVFDDKDIIEKLIGEGSKKPRGTKAYEEWKDAQLSFAQGKIMIDVQTMDALKAMREKLMSNRYVRSLLSDGEPEQSFYCTLKTMDECEAKLIMRTDYIKWQKRAVIELKTTQDASKDGFPKECANYDYHIQAALYADLMEMISGHEFMWTFFFIAQESKAPYAFNVFEASPQFIAQGRYEYEQLILLYQQCRDSGKWPGYQVWCENRFGINNLDLPKWAIRDLSFYNHK